MKQVVLSITLIVYSVCLYAEQKDTLSFMLNQAVNSKEHYIAIKEQNILKIKQILTIKDLLPRQKYDINKKLFDEYRKYCADSAIVFVRKNRDIAFQLDDPELIDETAIHLSWLYSTTGSYIEAADLLQNIKRVRLSERLLPAYYETYSAFCSHYGQSNNHQAYYQRSELYRDSLLGILDTSSLQYRIERAAERTFKRHDTKKTLLNLLDQVSKDNPDRGYIAWLVGYMYQHAGNKELCEKYYIISVINDIEYCIRDNASMQSLALIYFEEGNIALAYRFIHYAIEDALFCNVRYRMSEASTYYPIINAIYQEQERSQMAKLSKSLMAISLLLIILTIGLVFVYRQYQRLSRMRQKLSQTNQKLNELNSKLTFTNSNLQESNLVKEEYIAHFFDVCSAYVDKLETYRRILNKHAKNERIDEMLKMLNSSIIAQELEELYRKFDIIFLNLYPTFVDDFNAIRPEGEKIILKHGELMNTELRIFALIRLGINDSVKIASFLRYSMSAIYNYRVKARKCCNVDKKTFEDMLMKMGNTFSKDIK